MGIDIGLVKKHNDPAKAGDKPAVQRYKTLEKSATDGIVPQQLLGERHL